MTLDETARIVKARQGTYRAPVDTSCVYSRKVQGGGLSDCALRGECAGNCKHRATLAQNLAIGNAAAAWHRKAWGF